MVTSAITNCRDAHGEARETAPVPHRVSCPAFVGRAEELDVLEATLARVASGAAATVLVAGDAGIGKTRLVDEFCGRARGGGALVATGVCVPIEGGGLPYGPIVGIFRDLVRQSSGDELSDLLAPMASGLGLGPTGAARAGAYPAARSVADELAKTRRFESSSPASPHWPSAARSCSSSRTCTGPTPRAPSCSASSPGTWTPAGSC